MHNYYLILFCSKNKKPHHLNYTCACLISYMAIMRKFVYYLLKKDYDSNKSYISKRT